MSAKLKECPFCGNMPDIQETEAHKHHMKLGDFTMPDHLGCFTLECPTTGCCAMIAGTKEELVTAWERRTIAPPVAAGSVDTQRFDPLERYGEPAMQEVEEGDYVLYADAIGYGAQQREAGKAEEKDFIKECMVLGQDEFNRKWKEQKERAEKAEARMKELEEAISTDDRVLRSSVPERWKDCASPVGAVQSYIAELEEALQRSGYLD